MPQVAIMLPNGTVEKVDRESKESLDALRQVAALLLKAALQDQFKGIRLGKPLPKKTNSSLTPIRTTNKSPLTNWKAWKEPLRS